MNLTESLQSFLGLIHRRRRLVSWIFLLVGGLASLLVLASPPRFAAETTLLARFGREYVYRGDSASSMLVPNLAQDDIITSVTDIMKSNTLAEQVVSEVGPTVLYPVQASDPPEGMTPLQAATAEFTRALKFAPGRKSTVITVIYAHVDPVLAASTLNRFVADFQDKFLSLYGENRIEVMGREAEAAKAELTRVQEEASAYERAQGTYAKDGQLEALVQRKADLETQRAKLASCCAGSDSLRDVEAQVAGLGARIAAINESQGKITSLVARRDVAQENYDAILKRLSEAKASRAMDESRMTSVQVIDPATPPTRHERPGRIVKMILALVLAGVLAVAAACVAETFKRRYTTARDLRRAFPFPVLADVPLSKIRGA